MTQPLHSPFRWAENRQPTVFALDPAFRPRKAPAPSGKSPQYHIGVHSKALPSAREGGKP